MDLNPKTNYAVCGRCGKDIVFDWTFGYWISGGTTAACDLYYVDKTVHDPDAEPPTHLKRMAS